MRTILKVTSIITIVFLIGVCVITNPDFTLAGTVVSNNYTADTSSLKSHVDTLCAFPNRNSERVDVLDYVASYIFKQFKDQSLEVEEQKYVANGKWYKNIIASYGPKDAERIIVGAHYDVCGVQQGADDNASGVAGLLEIARLLNRHKPTSKYRIDLVAYTLEEPPYFRTEFMGSAIHAKMLYDNHIKVKEMLSLEMIGFFSDKPKSQEYPLNLLKLFYPTKANFITVVGKMGQGSTVRSIKRAMRKGCVIDVRSINAPSFVPGIDFSDHLNYWKYGFDAVMITDTSFYRNKNYHEKSDVSTTLNFKKMAEVVRGVFCAIIH